MRKEESWEAWVGKGVERWGWLDNEEVKDTMEREGGRSGQREGQKTRESQKGTEVESEKKRGHKRGWEGGGYLSIRSE